MPPERDRQEAALVIQAMLAEAGITMTIQTQENVTMLTAGRKGDFEAYFTFWSGRPDPDGNIFTFTTCNGGQNDSKYCNQDIDAHPHEGAPRVGPRRAQEALRPGDRDHAARPSAPDPAGTAAIFTGHTVRLQGFTPYPDGIIRLKGLKL